MNNKFDISAQLYDIEEERYRVNRLLDKKEIDIYERVLNIKITFGKYKGKTISEIQDIDPQYVTWLFSDKSITGLNIDGFHLIKIKDYHDIKNSKPKEYDDISGGMKYLTEKCNISEAVAYDILTNRNCRDFGM